MQNILNAIAKAMREIVDRINLPIGPSSMVRDIKHTVGGEIPHVGVGIVEDVLLHAEEGFLRAVFAVVHGAEFGQGFADGAIAVGTFKVGVFFAFVASAPFVYFLGYKKGRPSALCSEMRSLGNGGCLYPCNDRHIPCRV
jgi:hypothetical protein